MQGKGRIVYITLRHRKILESSAVFDHFVFLHVGEFRSHPVHMRQHRGVWRAFVRRMMALRAPNRGGNGALRAGEVKARARLGESSFAGPIAHASTYHAQNSSRSNLQL